LIKRSAILFQTHIISNDILSEFQNISNESEGIGDAYLLCDDKKIDITKKVKKYRYICFNKEGISDLNYPIVKDEQRGAEVPLNKAFQYCNYQLSILKFFLENRDYDYYWYIEYDVRYSGKWRDFFDYFNNDKDLITSHIRFYDEEPKWLFWYLKHPNLSIPDLKRIRSFNPVMRISNKALTYLHESFLDGWIGHLEVLIPTLLHNNGFELEDFGGSGKFCQKENINRNYIGSDNNTNGELDHGTMRYRPHPIYLGLRKNMLYHPIKPAKDTVKYYLKRYIRLLKRIIRIF